MSMIRRALIGLALLLGALWAAPAEAASCFWVGGTGTWNAVNAASWSSSSGGTASTCAAAGGIPNTSSDAAIFDGSSGGGTVTVNTNITLATLTIGAFTGTLDFSANNNNITANSVSLTGAGTKTLNMGSGTWTLAGLGGSVWDCTTCANLTLSALGSTINISNGSPNNSRNFVGGSKHYGTLTFAASPTPTNDAPFNVTGPMTVDTWNISAPNWVRLSQGTYTITNAFSWGGTAFNSALMIDGGTGTQNTISSASNGTLNWAAITGLTFTGGGTFTATNSFNVNSNVNIAITGPSGGGSRCIGC